VGPIDADARGEEVQDQAGVVGDELVLLLSGQRGRHHIAAHNGAAALLREGLPLGAAVPELGHDLLVPQRPVEGVRPHQDQLAGHLAVFLFIAARVVQQGEAQQVAAPAGHPWLLRHRLHPAEFFAHGRQKPVQRRHLRRSLKYRDKKIDGMPFLDKGIPTLFHMRPPLFDKFLLLYRKNAAASIRPPAGRQVKNLPDQISPGILPGKIRILMADFQMR